MSSGRLRPRVVVIAPFDAYRGVPHAGGEHLRRHLEVLSESMSVTLITPDCSGPVNGAQHRSWDVVHLSLPGSWPLDAVDRLRKFFLGGALPWYVGRAIKHDSSLQRLIGEADYIEYQWSEAMSVWAALHKLNPSASTRLFMHDVVTQRWLRAARHGGMSLGSLGSLARLATALVGDLRRMRRADAVGVLSEKDAGLLRRYFRVKTPVMVVRPWLADSEMFPVCEARGRREGSREVLFTGALNRAENEEGLLWFLDHVWPDVLARVGPSLHLTIAGANPSQRLMARVERMPVTVTGYVESLSPYYRGADVFVAPLSRGAGIKFKTIVAMLWGVPIVATPVAAEGVGSNEEYVAITEDAQTFADALVLALSDAGLREAVGLRAYKWAHAEFGRDQFRTALGLYFSSGAWASAPDTPGTQSRPG